MTLRKTSNVVALMAVIGTVAFLAPSAVLATQGCKFVKAKWTLSSLDCLLDGEFGICLGGPLAGSVNGNFVYHETGFEPFPDGSSAHVSWGLDIIATDQGDLLGTERVLVDPFSVGFVSILTIERGTGRYEGAHGNIVVRGVHDGAELEGTICGLKQ